MSRLRLGPKPHGSRRMAAQYFSTGPIHSALVGFILLQKHLYGFDFLLIYCTRIFVIVC